MDVLVGLGGSAQRGTDYDLTTGEFSSSSGHLIRFADGSPTAQLVVDPIGDELGELDETVQFTIVSLAGAGPGYSLSIGPDDSATGIIADDDVGAVNTPPTASTFGPTTGVPGQPLTFNFSATDPAPHDAGSSFTYRIDWDGDGSVDEAAAGPASGITRTHIYPSLGSYSLTVTADDGDAVGPSSSHTVVISQFVIAGGDLVVGGTAGDDLLVFTTPKGGGIQVWLNQLSLGKFKPTGRLIAYGGSGNDWLAAEGDIRLTMLLDGGQGNDILTGGNGPNVLIGGTGNDAIVGGKGRSILVGGFGSDLLYGASGDDRLIAGTTDFDANLVALLSILDEWNSSRNFEQRVANLSGTGTGASFAARRNQSNYLTQQTVHDDGDVDLVAGGSGRDWLFANLDVLPRDVLLSLFDKLTDIDQPGRLFRTLPYQ